MTSRAGSSATPVTPVAIYGTVLRSPTHVRNPPADQFCADLPAELALAMSLAQRPIAAAAFAEEATGAGWKTVPSWYQIARHDNALSPQAQRFMAERMGATTEEVDGSHVAFIAQPRRTAGLIKAALSKL
ncbi:alpha/beta fold hydrolase [Kitasatospora aureofaciens]|uniref:alpha/beta fold hydrolase n=1 Tax=Kitasatospora aureofaciens TaxID=1894 RepID=UPI0030B82B20